MIVLDILSIILIIVLFGAAVVGVYQCEKKEAGKKNEKHNF